MIKNGKLFLKSNSSEIALLEHVNFFIPTQTREWLSLNTGQYIKILPNDILRVNIGFSFKDTSIVQHVEMLLGENKLQGYIELEDLNSNKIYSREVNLI